MAWTETLAITSVRIVFLRTHFCAFFFNKRDCPWLNEADPCFYAFPSFRAIFEINIFLSQIHPLKMYTLKQLPYEIFKINNFFRANFLQQSSS